jgi:anti-sigma regulatory factor (Ser/Thr protein kinase)
MIAVGEAVTNALQHSAPPVRVQAFPDGGVARVRVHNPGSAAVFATAGYHRPNTASGGGIGLWLARQLADVVTIHLGTAETTVELSFPMTGRP